MPKKSANPQAMPVGWKPVEGWQVQGSQWFLRGKDVAGQPVDLVRLADLIRWLQASKGVPRVDALQAVIDGLPSDVMDWLYQAQSTTWAQPVPKSATFGLPTESSIAATKEMQRQQNAQRQWEAKQGRFGSTFRVPTARIATVEPLLEPVPTEPGRPALVRYMAKWLKTRAMLPGKGAQPIDSLDLRAEVFSVLAIPHAKAWEVWGWGTVDGLSVQGSVKEALAQPTESAPPTTWAQLKRYHKDNPGHSWSPPGMRQILMTEERRRKDAGHTGIRKAMAHELGMTPSGVGEHIRKAASGTKSGRGRKAA